MCLAPLVGDMEIGRQERTELSGPEFELKLCPAGLGMALSLPLSFPRPSLGTIGGLMSVGHYTA